MSLEEKDIAEITKALMDTFKQASELHAQRAPYTLGISDEQKVMSETGLALAMFHNSGISPNGPR